MNANRTVTATFGAVLSSIDVLPTQHQLNVGWSWVYYATPRRADGTPITGLNVNWSSSNPAVAAVDSTGRVRGISAGTAVITAGIGTISGRVNVTVSADQCAPQPLFLLQSTMQASFHPASCRVSGRPSDYFAFRSQQRFSMAARVTSTTMQLATYWYTANNLTLVRALGGSFEPLSDTIHTTLAILPPGDYAIEVTAQDGRNGSYRATLDIGNADPVVTGCNFAFVVPPFDYFGSIASTDCSPRSSTVAPRGNFDQFVLQMRVGERVAIDLNSSAVDTYLQMRDLNGNIVASNDFFSPTSSRIDFTSTTGGLYIIDANTAGAGETGAYRLVITSNLAAIRAAPEVFAPMPFDALITPRNARDPQRAQTSAIGATNGR
jgi:hypothetical protein